MEKFLMKIEIEEENGIYYYSLRVSRNAGESWTDVFDHIRGMDQINPYIWEISKLSLHGYKLTGTEFATESPLRVAPLPQELEAPQKPQKLMKILFTPNGSLQGDLYCLMKSEDGGASWKFHVGCVLGHSAASSAGPAEYMNRIIVDEMMKLVKDGYIFVD